MHFIVKTHNKTQHIKHIINIIIKLLYFHNKFRAQRDNK